MEDPTTPRRRTGRGPALTACAAAAVLALLATGGARAAGSDAPSGPGEPPAPPVPPVTRYLADLEPLDSAGLGTGSADVNGTPFARSVFLAVDKGSRPQGYAEYDLGRDWRTLTATIGLRDDSPTGCELRFESAADGRTLDSETLGIGESRQVALDVTRALRLKLQVTYASTTDVTQYCHGVWADARLTADAPPDTPIAGRPATTTAGPARDDGGDTDTDHWVRGELFPLLSAVKADLAASEATGYAARCDRLQRESDHMTDVALDGPSAPLDNAVSAVGRYLALVSANCGAHPGAVGPYAAGFADAVEGTLKPALAARGYELPG
ncbi:NPCBM/NEW2 domain-containing protein [Streptomyces sp. NPDC059917]|uniref:NPCBM/NEW2 domain-containing protein n=1 Tax=Streptomyces sp. NPDC059917 TaxID=3347002 RepID=UPI00364C0EA5